MSGTLPGLPPPMSVFSLKLTHRTQTLLVEKMVVRGMLGPRVTREVHPLRTTSTTSETPWVPGVYTPGIYIRNVWTPRIKTSAWGQVACASAAPSPGPVGPPLSSLKLSHLCRILNMTVMHLYSLSQQEFPKMCITCLIKFSPSVPSFFLAFLPSNACQYVA